MSLIVDHVTRSFGATRAVDDVSLSIEPGQIVGLIGENGAGKTTLMRIAAGELRPDTGRIVRPDGVGIVHQHFALVSHFTIAENLALVRDRRFRFVSRARLEHEARETIAATEVDLPHVSRLAADLSVGERAKLELIKAVASHPDLLILDEPTSVLTPLETVDLFRLMRRLAASGTAVVFITHKIAEVMDVAERLIVMRRGRVVADTPAKGMSAQRIADSMMGGLGVNAGSSLAHGVVKPASTQMSSDPVVHRGEIVAIVGVAGNGQGELAERLRNTPGFRIGFIPEDRTRHGLIGEMSIAENIALRNGRKNARERAVRLIDAYRIKARGPDQLAGELSGGNQQKVLLARELDRQPDLLIASEPTRGLDVEATQFVHARLRAAVDAGAGLVLITSDLDEAFALAGSIHVIYRGALSAPMRPDEAPARVATLMAGIA